MESTKTKLEDQNYLDLWEYFNEDTAKIKDKLWTIVSWLYTLMSGLVAFMVNQGTAKQPKMVLVIAVALIGILLSIYTDFMIREYGRHIRGGWNVTDFLMSKIEGFEEVWNSRGTKEKTNPMENKQSLPPFTHRLLWLAWGYGLVFLILAAS